MSSPAAARAEARRKAILSRGSDRLAKLTTSGRGEDAPAYINNDPPIPRLSSLSNFVGEETASMPRNDLTDGTDPSVWGEDQQAQLMQAFMMAQNVPSPSANGGHTNKSRQYNDTEPPPMPSVEDNPFLAQLMAASDGAGPAGPASVRAPPKPKTIIQKLLPIIHLVSVWCLLAYFVALHEPKLHDAMGPLIDEQKDRVIQRWAAFAKEVARVQAVPFFWALTTVQIILHSTRLFTGLDRQQLPTLLSMAMPVLPPTISTVIVNGYRYIGLLSMLLDDVAGILVAIGLFVYVSTWLAA